MEGRGVLRKDKYLHLKSVQNMSTSTRHVHHWMCPSGKHLQTVQISGAELPQLAETSPGTSVSKLQLCSLPGILRHSSFSPVARRESESHVSRPK